MQTNKTKFSDFSLQDNQLFMYSSTLEQGKNKYFLSLFEGRNHPNSLRKEWKAERRGK